MKIASIGAALALAMGAASARLDCAVGGAAVGGGRRIAGGTKRARQMASAQTPHNRSKYMPHIGAKEQERAKRCYMTRVHGDYPFAERSTPTMCQANRSFDKFPF
jgi:hypothetical protein